MTESGSYRVEVHYVPGADRATAAPYTVHHAGATPTTVTVNQTSGSGSGTWKSIGTWNFNAGTTHKIVLGDVASKVVVADAVRLTKTATDVKTVNQSNVWHSFSVRSTVQAWLNGTQPNHGFMLKASDETLNRGGPRYEAAEYAYEGETRNTPKLLLTYGRPGATLNPPTTVRATGADLTWGAYLDPSAAIGDNLVEYQVHRSVWQNFMPSAATLVAPVPPGRTSYADTSATPTPADSPELGTAYFYMIAVKTADGQVLPSQTEQVRLPKAGQVLRVFQDAVDTTLSSTESTTGHDVLAGKPWLSVGNNSGTYGKTRAVVKFPSLAGVPAGARVLDADVDLWGFYTYRDGAAAAYEARALTRDFDEASASWTRASSATAWTTAGGDLEPGQYGTVGSLTNDPAWRSFDADQLVQRWVNDPASNRGILVKLVNETSPLERTIFVSGETAEPRLRPKLTVLYTEPTSANTYYAPTTPDRMIPGDEYVVPVTVTNTTASAWSSADWVLSYHWEWADGTDVTNSGNRRETPLPATLPSTGVVTLNAVVMTPVRSDEGNKREAFVLKWDMRNRTTGQWLSQISAILPLPQNVQVEDPTSDQLGLEKFYQYAGQDAGAGMNVLVNEFSGNAVVGYNAFVNPGRGLATSLRVTYNSQDTSKSFLGYGWSLSASSITRLGTPVQFRGNNQWPQQVDYTDGDGTTHVFELNKHGSTDETLWTYDQPAGVHLHLQRTNSGDPIREWVLTRPDRTQVFLDGQGYQTAMRDRNGNELLFTYERKQVNNRNSGVLRYVTDAATRQTLTLDYYAKGDSYTYYSGDTRLGGTNLTNGLITDQLKSVTDISNRTLLFIYSDKGLLREIDDGYGKPEEKRFVFSYETTVGAPVAKLIGARDPRGNSTAISYYDTNAGQLLRLRANTITDRMNKVTTFGYVDPDGTTGSQIRTTVTDANAHTTTDLIDGFGRLTTSTNARNELTELTWDADNNVRRLAEANGAVTTWVYDANTGYPLEIKDPEANRNGTTPVALTYRTGLNGHTAELLTKTSPEGRTWTFGYDAFGNLTSVTDPKGTATPLAGDYTTTYTYDSFGQLLTETDANEHTTTYANYAPVGYPQHITNALSFRTEYTYDTRGNVVSILDARLKRSDFTYDTFGRPLTTKVPKDADAGVYLTTPAPSYDGNDNVTREIAANGAVTTAVYDAADQVTSVSDPKDTPTSPARTTTYTYDDVGNLVQQTEPKGTLTPEPSDFVTTFGYDELNRIVSATDAANGTVTVEYDNVGNVVVEVDQRKYASADPNDYTAKYTYDLNHRPTTVTDVLGFTTKTEYDRDSNVTATVDQENNRTILKYDERSALVEEKVPHTSAGGTATYHTTRYEYDEVGNPTRVISPRGVETTGDPDDFAQVTVYDELNRIKEKWTPFDLGDVRYKTPDKFLYGYDAVGNLTTVSAPPSEGQTQRAVTTNTYWDNQWMRTTTDPVEHPRRVRLRRSRRADQPEALRRRRGAPHDDVDLLPGR